MDLDLIRNGAEQFQHHFPISVDYVFGNCGIGEKSSEGTATAYMLAQ